ncbi:hypothetical protein FHETE_10748 [Fusarium heterosporum]|uniref:Uncharacterized protein n=1 Tax=Fusarium heterosporum TaxID=42747 RepID=A0A8H5WBZ9_FUSHE|nr:hypothetical protein FHETE_10748 [Fusarium heterosporum]
MVNMKSHWPIFRTASKVTATIFKTKENYGTKIAKHTITAAVSNHVRGNSHDDKADGYPEINHESMKAPKDIGMTDDNPADYAPQHGLRPTDTGSRGNNKSKSVRTARDISTKKVLHATNVIDVARKGVEKTG